MALLFPTSLFGFNTQEVNIERQTLKGGTALSGEQDKVATDGGGRVFAEFTDGDLIDRSKNLAWRALTTQLEEGVTPVVVPFCDPRHQPTGGPGSLSVPHSDDTPFSDDSLYDSGNPGATTTAAAILRATTLSLALDLSTPLLGGEWFSIEHPSKGWRAYRVAQVLEQSGAGAVVTFRPPLREAVDVGEGANFRKPRCLMVADGLPSNRIQYRRHTQAAIRFVEAP